MVAVEHRGLLDRLRFLELGSILETALQVQRVSIHFTELDGVFENILRFSYRFGCEHIDRPC